MRDIDSTAISAMMREYLDATEAVLLPNLGEAIYPSEETLQKIHDKSIELASGLEERLAIATREELQPCLKQLAQEMAQDYFLCFHFRNIVEFRPGTAVPPAETKAESIKAVDALQAQIARRYLARFEELGLDDNQSYYILGQIIKNAVLYSVEIYGRSFHVEPQDASIGRNKPAAIKVHEVINHGRACAHSLDAFLTSERK